MEISREKLPITWQIKGALCIKSAEKLYREEGINSGFEILLIHGIELELNAYLLLHNPSMMPRKIYTLFRHDYSKIYNYAKHLGSKYIQDEQLGKILNFLSNNFHKDTIEVRYPKESKKILFPEAIFEIIDSKLVVPLTNEVRSYSKSLK